MNTNELPNEGREKNANLNDSVVVEPLLNDAIYAIAAFCNVDPPISVFGI